MSELRTRIVTAEQLKMGYWEKIGMLAYQRRYLAIEQLRDGTYVVKEPGQELEKAKSAK